LIGFAVEDDDLAESIEEHDAADGREGGGAEKAVISAGVAPDDGARGEATDAVGDEPFLGKMRQKFPVGFDGEEWHGGSVIFWAVGGYWEQNASSTFAHLPLPKSDDSLPTDGC
jgi:hypothetical protein